MVSLSGHLTKSPKTLSISTVGMSNVTTPATKPIKVLAFSGIGTFVSGR